MLLFLNQFIKTSDSDCKMLFNSVTVFAVVDKELSSTKLNIDALETKNSKSFIEKLNLIGSVMEPWGYQKLSFENPFLCHLYEHLDFDF